MCNDSVSILRGWFNREFVDGSLPGRGPIILTNGARESEIDDLATCLVAMGVRMGASVMTS
jgi:hypothetical protein